MDHVYFPVIGIAKTLFALQGLRFTVTGAQNVPKHGGAVLAINHTGYLDFTYAGNAVLPRGRFVRFMAKESIFKNPVAGPLMKGMKHIPVDRAAGGAAYRRAVAALRDGEIVGVYPEATISRAFELKDFKVGAARMARDAGVPIIPCVIWEPSGCGPRITRSGWAAPTPPSTSISAPRSMSRQRRTRTR